MTDSTAPPLLGRLASFLALFSLASIGVGLWLGWTSAIVLPRQDPALAATWLAVAGGLVAYSGLCSALLRAPGSAAGLRGFVVAVSLVALGLGLYGIGRHFDGRSLLVSCVVVVHAICALTYAWVRRGVVVEEKTE